MANQGQSRIIRIKNKTTLATLFMPKMNAKTTYTTTYADFSLRSLRSLAAIHDWLPPCPLVRVADPPFII
jgi:hypothetical protein